METIVNLKIPLMTEQDKRIAETFIRERSRLQRFIRQRVPDPGDAEDIVQDVFFEFIEAYRLPESIEQIGAWLYRVARNRITDRFRKKKAVPYSHLAEVDTLSAETGAADEARWLDTLLITDDGPEAAYIRYQFFEALERALDELPKVQRDVFIAHECEGRSFNQMAQEQGLRLNTLLARKRHAVLHLRIRLQSFYPLIYSEGKLS